MDKSQPTKPATKSANTPENMVLEMMKERGMPLTRENYLHMAYWGNPPEDTGGEIEAEIPWEIKRNDRQPKQKEKPEAAG